MALSVDYSQTPFLITIPKADTTLRSGTVYELTVDELWQLLRDYGDSEEAIAYPKIYRRIPATETTPAITEINENYYAAQFEDGLYAVEIINGNTNFRTVEVKNQVSVGTNNTSGASALTEQDKTDIISGVWANVKALTVGKFLGLK